MKTVRIAIEELCVQEFDIIADGDNMEDAINRAIEKYKNGELVLEPGEVQARRIAVIKPNSSEWIEF